MLCKPLAGPAPPKNGASPASAPVPSVGVPEAHFEKPAFGVTSPGTASGNRPGGPRGAGQVPGSTIAESTPFPATTPAFWLGSVVPTGHGTLMLFPRTNRCAPTKREP